MQAYIQGDFAEALQDFQAARKKIASDPLVGLWLGIAQVASGDHSGGYFTLEFALEGGSPLTAMDFELAALAHWQEGDTANAKTVLQDCKTPLCKKMVMGIDSGASAPAPQDWPKIVGLDKITIARATTWSP